MYLPFIKYTPFIYHFAKLIICIIHYPLNNTANYISLLICYTGKNKQTKQKQNKKPLPITKTKHNNNNKTCT